VAAALLLIASWNTIAAACGVRTGITACDRGDVDGFSRGTFFKSTTFEPAEQRFSGSSGEWLPAFRFDFSGSLSHKHYFRLARRCDYGPDSGR
jgi:hypothetical protein